MPFSFFQHRTPEIKITDKIWISETAKWKACVQAYEQNKSTLFIAWFQDTQRKLQLYFSQNNKPEATVSLYRNVHPHMLSNQQLIFVEHYPLSKNEQDLFSFLKLKEVLVFSSLDESFFQYFGGEKLITIMQNIGMQQDEPVEHSMITRALRNAQDKLNKKILLEQSARSQQEWLNKNIH